MGPWKNGRKPRVFLQEGEDELLEERDEHEDPPRARRPRSGIAASSSITKATGWRSDLGRELGDVDRHTQRQRHRDQQGEQRGEQGAEDQRKGTELLGHRVPGGLGDEAEAEAINRQPGPRVQLVDQEGEEDRDGKGGSRQAPAEQPVASGHGPAGERGSGVSGRHHLFDGGSRAGHGGERRSDGPVLGHGIVTDVSRVWVDRRFRVPSDEQSAASARRTQTLHKREEAVSSR